MSVVCINVCVVACACRSMSVHVRSVCARVCDTCVYACACMCVSECVGVCVEREGECTCVFCPIHVSYFTVLVHCVHACVRSR